jgi:acetolactate synthase-1/2/3 large subunit
MAPTRTGGEILVDALRRNGIDLVYCVPGESYLAVLDAFYARPQIRVVSARHEASAANMAEADGKLTGRPGICFVTRGPGATHASTGVHTAMQDSTPLVLFVGQVARTMRGREAFQEIDYVQMFGAMA